MHRSKRKLQPSLEKLMHKQRANALMHESSECVSALVFRWDQTRRQWSHLKIIPVFGRVVIIFLLVAILQALLSPGRKAVAMPLKRSRSYGRAFFADQNQASILVRAP
ncbi:MAG: hypothetical protein P8Y47_09650 [Alphaproteobacteria bacterium]